MIEYKYNELPSGHSELVDLLMQLGIKSIMVDTPDDFTKTHDVTIFYKDSLNLGPVRVTD